SVKRNGAGLPNRAGLSENEEVVADMKMDVPEHSQPEPSALPHKDQVQPAGEREAADLRLPMDRGECPFDPPAEYQRLRDEDPVSRLAFPDGGNGWLL